MDENRSHWFTLKLLLVFVAVVVCVPISLKANEKEKEKLVSKRDKARTGKYVENTFQYSAYKANCCTMGNLIKTLRENNAHSRLVILRSVLFLLSLIFLSLGLSGVINKKIKQNAQKKIHLN